MKNFLSKLLLIVSCAVTQTTLDAKTVSQPQGKDYYFFSYGGYMNAKVVKEDLGYSPENLGVYRLDDYEFSYNRAPVHKNATGGNIHPQPGKAVYGVVWKLKEADMDLLDRSEQAPLVYTRTQFKVVSAKNPKNFKWVEAYVANPKYISKICFPRPFYVDIVTKGAEANHLPKEYIVNYLKWSGPWGEN